MISFAAAGGTWLLKGAPEEVAVAKCVSENLPEGEICPADVEGNILWVDARSRAEWEENSVGGSILWNLDPKEDMNEMEAGAVTRIAAGVDMVVVYCSSQACGTSKQIASRIRSLELGTPVKTLHGGWDAIRDSNPAP